MAQRGRPKGSPNAGRSEFRDALRVALHRIVENHKDPAKRRTNLMLVAEELISQAKGGDVSAIREIADRIDGRPVQSIGGVDNEGNATGTPKGIAIVFVGTDQE
jgi:hypothetical protein